ncbi:cupin domain-containing protein [Clostridium sp. TF11-13AC]|nr:cupin domain-containing protein [Clostridium sp. TF11-13AC]
MSKYFCWAAALLSTKNGIEWHWHTELEFIYIESGTVTLWIGEDQFHLTEGNGIFINTKVLHRLYSPSKALIPNFVFMPSFIAPCDSLIYQKYILPIISYPLPFLIFHINPNGIPET